MVVPVADEEPPAVGVPDEDISSNVAVFDGQHHKSLTLFHVPWCTICCRVRTMYDPHPAVLCDESFGAVANVECDYAEIKMTEDPQH